MGAVSQENMVSRPSREDPTDLDSVLSPPCTLNQIELNLNSKTEGGGPETVGEDVGQVWRLFQGLEVKLCQGPVHRASSRARRARYRLRAEIRTESPRSSQPRV